MTAYHPPEVADQAVLMVADVRAACKALGLPLADA